MDAFFLLGILVTIAILWIGREVVCWYFKYTEQVKNQEEIIKNQKEIISLLERIARS